MSLHLDHLNIRCRKPEWLADLYAEHLALTVKDRMIISSGLILVFVQGESLGAETPLPGFRCESRAELDRLAVLLDEPVVDEGDYRSLASAEPEGNRFEVYWEGS